jgi:hypothetical protein
MRLARLASALTVALSLLGNTAIAKRMPTPPDDPTYAEIVAAVAEMVSDGDAQSLAAGHGLGIVNVMWEDTGRWEDSAVGPNISDVTIEVEADPASHQRYLMPVIRFDNFTDKTGDVKLDRIFVPIGNEDGKSKLKTITLEQLLDHPGKYMSLPKEGKITGGSLLADRDSHALVSAQHAFLPVPADGKATFWPVIFNYQSYPENPAVLTILVTRQGSSMTIVDNNRDTIADGGSWGQRLYFNHDGQKAPLIAERLKDVKKQGKTRNGEDAASLGDDANLLMIIQVPLKQAQPPEMAYGGEAEYDESPPPPPADKEPSAKKAGGGSGVGKGRSDVDVAVIGHGDDEGPYTELAGLTVERDPRFPVRVTVQFYQATSNGVVDQDDLDRMADQIAKVYDKADYVGSLVVPGPNDRGRTTRWTGAGPQPDRLGWYHFPGLEHRYRLYGWHWVPDREPDRAGIK